MNNKKSKGGILSFILPYVLIAGIIITVVMLFNGFNKTETKGLYESDVITFTSTEYNDGIRARDNYDLSDDYLWDNLEDKLEKSFLYSANYEIQSCNIYAKTNITTISGRFKVVQDGETIFGGLKKSDRVYAYSCSFTANDETDFIVKAALREKGLVNNKTYAITYTDPYQSNFFKDYLPTILIFGVGILVVMFVFSRMSSSINKSNNSAMDFNRSRARREDNSPVRFKDVAGCDECKVEMEELVDYLRQPEKYAKFGAVIPKGVLLVGPPGTGKTLLAKAVAGEAKVPFYSISGSDFVEMFVGVGAGRVRDMFKKAKQTAPCLIFIDEIDAVGRQRGTGMGGGNDEREQTLNQLLVEMDGFANNSGIIVIAATNRDDVLDPALLRAGRFDRKITVDLPDKNGREEILKVHARNKKISKEISFENIAKRTVGFSGAGIASILNDAAILTVRNKKEEISIKEIDEAIDRRIAGPAKSNKSLSPREKEMIAYHEAGHAIIGLVVPHSDKVQKVTIVPRGRTGGHVLMTPEDDRFCMTESELKARIIGLLGGRSSEEVFFKDVGTGASNDIEVATRIARAMVTQYGMSSLGPIQYESNTGSVFLGRDYTNAQKNFSSQVANQIDSEIRKIIEDAHQQAIDTIVNNKDKVILIANTLMERETITAEEIEYLLANGSLDGMYAKKEEVVETPVVEEIKEETVTEVAPIQEETTPIEEEVTEEKE